MSTTMYSSNSVNYQGEVTFSTKINKRVYQIRKFNKGTKYISDLFSTAILGLPYGEDGDVNAVLPPRYLDFGYFTKDTSGGTNWDDPNLGSNSDDFFSMLSNWQVLTGRTTIVSESEETLGWRYPKFDAVVYINMFVQKKSEGSNIFACLRDINGHIIAMVDTEYTSVTGDQESLFGDSSNLVVNWVMKLFNADNEVSDVTEENAFPTSFRGATHTHTQQQEEQGG